MGGAKKAAVKPAAKKKKAAVKKRATAKPAAKNKATAKPATTEQRAVLVSTGTQPGETELVVPPATEAQCAAYEAEAKGVDPATVALSVPFGVFTGEALDAARFVWNRWETKRDESNAVITPGLELALSKAEREGKVPARISRRFAHEIAHLVTLAQGSHNDAILAASASGDSALDARAELVSAEIEAVLDWQFSSDGVLDERDAQLAQVRDSHASDGDSRDELAQRLQDYAALGNTYRDEIDDVGGFDVRLLDEAMELVDKLRATPRQPKPNERRMSAIELRNRYVVLVQRRVTMLRSAAQLVFRNHPKVIREVTSTYLRRRRAESRRAKVAKTDVKPDAKPKSDK